ncbi:Dabb family protein [Actinomadura barringtoniae]|uniref:Dabb family protein n=1 Tax=Actinomadura barringtoniae TaxID=1427535 RepID=A0A939P8T4_9ACTN|nr:Dabb family protein [Actinomadura barringtoniae]MBO2447868.1 Dabb family protein [Actinomadura barringtoniae]
MLTHVVLMKFGDPADAAKAGELLEGLVGTVEGIASMTLGLDVVHSEVSYDLCMITTHDHPDDLRSYQNHPAHLEVAGWLRPRLAGRVSVDFETTGAE